MSRSAPKSIFTTHEVSRLLQVNPRSVINWIEQDLLPSFRTPGGHRRIRQDDLLAFLRKHQIPTPAALVADTGFKVLIVDDEQETVQTLSAYMQRHAGYTTFAAADGISALIEIGRARPDLMILDILIPGVDGVEVCRRVKADSGNKTAIIAIGANSDEERSVLAAGADAFMPKPLDFEKVLAESKRLLRIL